MHTCIEYSKHVTKSAPCTRSSDTIVGFRGKNAAKIIEKIKKKWNPNPRIRVQYMADYGETKSNLLKAWSNMKIEVLVCNHHAVLDPRSASLISPHERLIVQQSPEPVLADNQALKSLSLSLSSLSWYRAARFFAKNDF